MRQLLAALVWLPAIGWYPAWPDALYYEPYRPQFHYSPAQGEAVVFRTEPYNEITLKSSGNIALQSGQTQELQSIWQP